jgi:hypothetical protein
MRLRYGIPLVAAFALFAAMGAHAAGDNDMAGCGMGAIWVQSPTNGPQVWASSTNQTFYSQLLGITFGTSGCSSTPGFSARRKAREQFIASNYKSLSRELAMGQGEYASSLATVMGCSNESVPAFLSFTKGNYETLFPSSETKPVQMLDTLEKQITTSDALSSVCTL